MSKSIKIIKDFRGEKRLYANSSKNTKQIFHAFLFDIRNYSTNVSNIILPRVNNFDTKQKMHIIFDLLYTHSTKQNKRDRILTMYSKFQWQRKSLFLFFEENSTSTFSATTHFSWNHSTIANVLVNQMNFDLCGKKLTILKIDTIMWYVC